jgi:Putative restriction endonuclease
MATVTEPTSPPIEPPTPLYVPALHNGDHLTRSEFERRYTAMPHVKKAELIEGVVYMPSPVSAQHSEPHSDLMGWLSLYRAFTPGIAGGDNGTLRLDLDNEPQPDGYLRILATHGGQCRIDADGYVAGAPELVAEVSVSRVSIDMHQKLHVYRRNGVKEYVVWRVEDQAIDWFILRGGQFDLLPMTGGQYRSETLPGLWLDAAALLAGDLARAFQVVQQGVGSPEHAAFIARLQQAARPTP